MRESRKRIKKTKEDEGDVEQYNALYTYLIFRCPERGSDMLDEATDD